MTSKKGAAKKGGAKKGAAKGGLKLAGGKEDFTDGDDNPNIRREEVGGSKRRPVQQELIADRKIAEIDDAARRYEDVKLQRMALTTREVELKDELKGIMKKYKKETYLCDGVEIVVSKEETETIKVKVAKQADDD